MEIIFYLRTAKSKPNDKNSVILRFNKSPRFPKPVIRGLGISIITKDWNQQAQRLKNSCSDSNKINKILSIIQSELFKINREEITAEVITRIVNAAKKGSKIYSTTNLVSILESKIQSLKGPKEKNNTVISYERTKAIVEEFQSSKNKNLSFSDNVLDDFTDFINYQRKAKLQDSTIRLHLDHIRSAVNRWATNRNEKIFFPKNTDFKWEKLEKEKIYLTKDEVNILFHFSMETNDELEESGQFDIGDLEVLDADRIIEYNKGKGIPRNPDHIRYLLYFLFRSFTGMRASEMTTENVNFSTVNPFDNSFSFEYFSKKTEQMVKIPILGMKYPFLISEKLGHDFPQEYTLAMQIQESLIVKKYYKLLQEFFPKRYFSSFSTLKGKKKYPVSDHITTHVARRTFARLIYNHKKDIHFVKTLLGHSSIVQTEKYLGLDNESEFEKYDDFKI
jgi:integrase